MTYVTIGEMTQWAQLRSWGARNRGALDHWLGSLVVINSSVEAARLWGTISGWGKLHGRSRPINDTWITTKVKSSLLADSDVAGTEVSVETINGVVHLSGYVDDQRQIDRAVEVARDIEGVTRVESSGLQLKTSDTD